MISNLTTAAPLLLVSQMQTEEDRSGKGTSKKSERGSASLSDSKTPLGSWVKVTDKAAFSPRDTAEDLVFDGKMWLSNGYYHGNILTRDLWSSTDGITWTLVNPNTPYDGYSEMVVYDNRMWAIKGSVWHSTDGVNWIQAIEYTPFGVRGYGEVVIHDGRMWQLGSGKDVWHSTNGVNWALATDDAPYGNRAAWANCGLWEAALQKPIRLLRRAIRSIRRTTTFGVQRMGQTGRVFWNMRRGLKGCGSFLKFTMAKCGSLEGMTM